MELPCKGCRGACCGPVPITGPEVKKIKKKIKSMPVKMRNELKNQQRFYGTCIFYDQDNDKCGIYSARPAICDAFGHYANLVCFRKPEAVKKEHWSPKEEPAGILSVDFKWEHFE
ncbi:hypothetical protein SAMN05444972_10258 [Marininema halotolerans]|uniref:Zinc-or iron-chelating domain-containing protein n=1 Tax=Marininema halotolerans TaxID=1155944 RepID=A0A1I6PQE5_9BACL|nr:hypothetical protein SAMN05444972_10258 [Marininema halotolerans]